MLDLALLLHRVWCASNDLVHSWLTVKSQLQYKILIKSASSCTFLLLLLAREHILPVYSYSWLAKIRQKATLLTPLCLLPRPPFRPTLRQCRCDGLPAQRRSRSLLVASQAHFLQLFLPFPCDWPALPASARISSCYPVEHILNVASQKPSHILISEYSYS
jgi:hypothetical protein